MEKITFVKRDNTDKEGNTLKTKDGRDYVRMTLKVESKGERYISGFGNAGNTGWKVGDEVDIVITEAEKTDSKGQKYLNFSQPKPIDKMGDDIKQIKDDIFKILLVVRNIDANTTAKSKVPYPTREDEGMTDEAPFPDSQEEPPNF